MAIEHHITSRQNERIKAAIKLRNSRQRAKQGRILIDGARPILRALNAGVIATEAFVCQELIHSPEGQEAAALVAENAETCSTVSEEVYAKLAFGDNEDGVVVVASRPERKLQDLQLPENSLVAVLEGLEKPGNVGAILRSADAAGVDAVSVVDPAADLYSPNTIRASTGTVFAGNVCQASFEETISHLKRWKTPIIAARPDATVLYSEIDYRQGAAIVLGSEAEGLTSRWEGDEVQAVRLPMRGMADSLNVSVTAAIVLYEALRQRTP